MRTRNGNAGGAPYIERNPTLVRSITSFPYIAKSLGRRCRTSSIQDVAKEHLLDWRTVKTQLQRRPAQEQALKQLIDELHMKAAGVAVRPNMRASKYSITSVKRLKIERCASSKTMRSKNAGENRS
jgi:hypothetical protein